MVSTAATARSSYASCPAASAMGVLETRMFGAAPFVLEDRLAVRREEKVLRHGDSRAVDQRPGSRDAGDAAPGPLADDRCEMLSLQEV